MPIIHHSREARTIRKRVNDYKRRMKKALERTESPQFTISPSATGCGVHIRWSDEPDIVAPTKRQPSPPPHAATPRPRRRHQSPASSRSGSPPLSDDQSEETDGDGRGFPLGTHRWESDDDSSTLSEDEGDDDSSGTGSSSDGSSVAEESSGEVTMTRVKSLTCFSR